MGNPDRYQRLVEAIEERFGEDFDPTEQYRFGGEKGQWNHHISAGLINLLNDVLMVSPRWIGRGGKAAFTSHCLYLGARIEAMMLLDPEVGVEGKMASLVANSRAQVTIDSIAFDKSTLDSIEKLYNDVEVDQLLNGMRDAVQGIAQHSYSTSCRQRAATMYTTITNRIARG